MIYENIHPDYLSENSTKNQPQPENPSLSGLKALAEQYGEKKADGETNKKPQQPLKTSFEHADDYIKSIVGTKDELGNVMDAWRPITGYGGMSYKSSGAVDLAIKHNDYDFEIIKNIEIDDSGNESVKGYQVPFGVFEDEQDAIEHLKLKGFDANANNVYPVSEYEDGEVFAFDVNSAGDVESFIKKIQAQSAGETNPNEGIGSGNWERENNDNNNVKPKKLSITRTPSLNTIAEHATKGWNAEKLSDDELAKALMYNRAAQTMRLNNDIIAKIPFSKRHSLSGAASKDLENKILAEYKKRGLDDKYEFDVNVLPKSEKSQQNTQSNAFTPTHESATGESLHHIEGNIYRDADGNEVEDNYASEVKD